ncbi:MAG TPA: FISUMP domain-containing protein, partial [Lentimicrobium sp.]|nr:FISUMP domain-containing protein [Lentimicrobium sp.]
GAYAWFDNANSWKDLYGALYNWHAVNSANGICPAGWHVPSHDEWKAFTDYLGGDFLMNVHEIKSCRQVNSPLGGNCTTSEHPRWNATDYGWGTDEYGFSGLPGGYRTWDGFYFSMGISGYFWSSTENSSSNAGYRLMINESNLFIPVSDDKRDGRSIRCVRDY